GAKFFAIGNNSYFLLLSRCRILQKINTFPTVLLPNINILTNGKPQDILPTLITLLTHYRMPYDKYKDSAAQRRIEVALMRIVTLEEALPTSKDISLFTPYKICWFVRDILYVLKVILLELDELKRENSRLDGR
ncbi:MAG: hypothetical protein KY428_10445, partial [Bacteroidetes bacterium]|nr:hypothetical protein [Bacteroidota bacterium]